MLRSYQNSLLAALPQKGQDEIHGRIEQLVFSNEETGFIVAKIILAAEVAGHSGKSGEQITVVGVMPSPFPGQMLTARGVWRNNPKFGLEFAAAWCECSMPTSSESIRLYLQSGMVKGIGKEYAGRIVDHFGDQTLRVLDEEPDLLRQVKGIGRKRLAQVKDSWEEHRGVRDLMLFLQSNGVSPSYAMRIYRFYGGAGLAVLHENPYRLAVDIPGIGFLTADRIAGQIGVDSRSPQRVRAGLIHVMDQSADKGHVFCPREELISLAGELLALDSDLLEQELDALVAEGRLYLEIFEDDESGRTFQAIYLSSLYAAEQGVVRRLSLLLAAPKTVRPIDPDKAAQWVAERLGLELAQEQIEAVRQAAGNKLLVITGGPGTGKTTIIQAILRIFEAAKARIALAAPTGRAAKRMTETSGREAKTVHRLLEYTPQRGMFTRNENNPLACDLLVLDEASMIDLPLMHHLLKAVPLGATLILVGDMNQLPSVGPGNVLKDVIESGAASVVRLTEIFRQARQSSIVLNAHAVNDGRLPLQNPKAENGELSDFYLIEQSDPERMVDLILEMVLRRIPRRFKFDPMEDVQVLTPMHKGLIGALNLNNCLQDALNRNSSQVQRAGRNFRLGDKVMQLRNNYDKEVFNGDIGRIISVECEAQRLAVRFGDRLVPYEPSDLDELTPAYAISIHKSQGSEYPAVIIPLHTQHYIMLQRNLLYTAITRGRRLVVLIGSERALALAVKNNQTQRRYTSLKLRLQKNLG